MLRLGLIRRHVRLRRMKVRQRVPPYIEEEDRSTTAGLIALGRAFGIPAPVVDLMSLLSP